MQSESITFWIAFASAAAIIWMNISAALKNKTEADKNGGQLSVMLTDAAKNLVEPLIARIDELEEAGKTKDKRILDLEHSINGMKSEITQLSGMVKDRDRKIDEYERRIKELENEVIRLSCENDKLRCASDE